MGVTLTIQDKNGNHSTGQDGEVCAKAGNYMQEYWNRPDETARAFREGWYHTGDAGHLDEAGYVYLVDRVTDMIVTGGENVYSIEVENVIANHPAVVEVAVIGIPPTWGEAVHAIVVNRQGASVTEEEIKGVPGERIARYKVPKFSRVPHGAAATLGSDEVLKR